MKPVETRAFEIGFKRPPCMRRSGVLSMSGCFFALTSGRVKTDWLRKFANGMRKFVGNAMVTPMHHEAAVE
jgi:hypothetical protein